MYQANLWTGAFEVVDPAARATFFVLNVASRLFGNNWINPLVGQVNYYSQEQFGSGVLATIFQSLSLLAPVAALLMLIHMKDLSSHDYPGLRQQKSG